MKLYWAEANHPASQSKISGHRYRRRINADNNLVSILRRNGWLRPDVKTYCYVYEDDVDFWTWLFP